MSFKLSDYFSLLIITCCQKQKNKTYTSSGLGVFHTQPLNVADIKKASVNVSRLLYL